MSTDLEPRRRERSTVDGLVVVEATAAKDPSRSRRVALRFVIAWLAIAVALVAGGMVFALRASVPAATVHRTSLPGQLAASARFAPDRAASMVHSPRFAPDRADVMIHSPRA